MGKTVEQAIANAAELLRDWIQVKEEHGEKPPAPQPSRSCVEMQMSPKQSLTARRLLAVPLEPS